LFLYSTRGYKNPIGSGSSGLGEKSCRSLFSVPFSVSPVIENQLRNAGNKGGKMKRKVYLILAGVDEGKNHGI
jgi:hypothetical protein